jgi:leucyl aminopeptidase
MLLMKKDMAGSAVCLGLFHMIASLGLDVRLRVLLPMVENAIASDAYHPGDVLSSRKGLTVEIGNTDAEGRLILADALAEADRERPDLMIDFATLTGAARVALGPELAALYAKNDDLAATLTAIGGEESDFMWRMPLWAPYDEWLDSKIADMNNISGGSFAGSITAALFLQRFVTRTDNWMHLDLFGWSAKPRPGHPEGAEPQTMRAVYRLIERHFAGRPKKIKRRG